MPALELDKLTWPEVKAELDAGRDTVVIALGATEQHGPHLPLATDALLGDELARAVADRIGAFVAPTVRGWVLVPPHGLSGHALLGGVDVPRDRRRRRPVARARRLPAGGAAPGPRR